MKDLNPLGGDDFNETAHSGYSQVLNLKEKSITFKFNGVRVIMFMDEER